MPEDLACGQYSVGNEAHMTRVVSIRMPEVLARAVRGNATRSEMPISELVRWFLGHVLEDGCNVFELSDPTGCLDSKLDIRLSDETLSQIRSQCEGLNLSVSTYLRIVLYAYYTRRLVFAETGDRYTLVTNDDQT